MREGNCLGTAKATKVYWVLTALQCLTSPKAKSSGGKWCRELPRNRNPNRLQSVSDNNDFLSLLTSDVVAAVQLVS